MTRSYFSGHRNKEVAYFHSASKTLIEADLLFNLPANEQVRIVLYIGPRTPTNI
jgi:hypothetical protein